MALAYRAAGCSSCGVALHGLNRRFCARLRLRAFALLARVLVRATGVVITGSLRAGDGPLSRNGAGALLTRRRSTTSYLLHH